MSTIDEISRLKKRNEERLLQMMSSYLNKYVRLLYEESSSLKDFQTKLLDVATMDEGRKEKETAKFVKWCDKKDLGSPDKLLRAIVDGYVSLVLYKYKGRLDTRNLRLLDDKVKLSKLWYKSLRGVAKYYYSNPKTSKSDITIYNAVVVKLIDDMMPFRLVLEWMKDFESHESENAQRFVSYNFHNSKDSKSEHSESHHTTPKSLSERGHELKYISSDEIVNEYYQSESEKEREHLRASGERDEKNVKYIEFK